jgi:hypothetical protein
MKPTLTTPNTLLLGCWYEAARCGLVASLRSAEYWLSSADDGEIVTELAYRWGGDIRHDVGQWTGPLWPTLASALNDLTCVGCRHLLFIGNDPVLCHTLARAQAPAPTQHTRQWLVGWGKEGQKGTYVDIPWGGDAAHWRVLVQLGTTWAGNWAVVCRADFLQKARTLWLQQ